MEQIRAGPNELKLEERYWRKNRRAKRNEDKAQEKEKIG
jgi:hypothetical protein